MPEVTDQQVEEAAGLPGPVNDQVGVFAAGRGQCVEVFAAVGSVVQQGSPLLAVSLLKMEQIVRAPEAGRVVAVLPPGQRASSQGLVAVVAPTGDLATSGEISKVEVGWAREMETIDQMKAHAEMLGGEKGVARQKAQGKLTVRERISLLVHDFEVCVCVCVCVCV